MLSKSLLRFQNVNPERGRKLGAAVQATSVIAASFQNVNPERGRKL